ncbi:hypothetical protein GYH30_031513 [Glycine max]|nr:hypothetical protein GYH30_031513 [Glycine max]
MLFLLRTASDLLRCSVWLGEVKVIPVIMLLRFYSITSSSPLWIVLHFLL